MEVNYFKLLITAVLIIIDFYLQKYLRIKGEIFVEINKYKFSCAIAGIFLVSLIYLIVNKKYLLSICCLSLLRIIDKLLYIYKKRMF